MKKYIKPEMATCKIQTPLLSGSTTITIDGQDADPSIPVNSKGGSFEYPSVDEEDD